jgi:thiamine phosphate synthase YjbQ (UPF0047 family)
MKHLFQTSLTIMILLTSTTAFADHYMKQIQRTDPYTVMGQSQPATTKTIESWLSDAAVLTNNSDDISTLVIFAKQLAYIIKHSEHIYTEMPMDMEKTIVEMAKSGDNDEESQAGADAMAEMMSAMMQMEVTVKDTGEQQKIGKWQARKYIQTLNMGMGTSTSEIWATEDLHADMSGYWKAANAMMAGQKGFAEMIREMGKIRGVVVKTISRSQVMGSEVKTISELVEFTDKSAPVGTFSIPAGYKLVPMFSK